MMFHGAFFSKARAHAEISASAGPEESDLTQPSIIRCMHFLMQTLTFKEKEELSPLLIDPHPGAPITTTG